MSAPSEDDDLLSRVRAGSESAAGELFNRYVHRLLLLARSRIGHRMTSRIDPEDVVQSVFRTFFVRLKQDRFDLDGMDDLSRLLIGITVRKTLRQIAYHRAARRDPSAEVAQGSDAQAHMAQLLDDEPSAETVVSFCDELEHLLSRFAPEDRKIIELRIQGYSSEEIAQQLGTYDRKVRRVLERVRSTVEQEPDSPPPPDN